MGISNVTGNAGVSLSLVNQVMKHQKKGQELSPILELQLEKQQEKTGSKMGASGSPIGLYLYENRRNLLLQACDSDLNMTMGDIELSESIRNVGETVNKLSVQSLLAEKTSCTYSMKGEEELSYFTFYKKELPV